MQQIIDQIIPVSYWNEVESGVDVEKLIYRMRDNLPIFKHTEIEDTSDSFAITYLCPADYTHQARRFVVDTLSRWLIPGKPVEISGGISLFFEFVHAPEIRFFAAQDIVTIGSKEENLAIRRNLPDLIGQLKNKLPCEFTRKAEFSVHPIFMPRNEEDTIRNLIVISSQIRYLKDLPQVSIYYEKQTDLDLIFTVIIARLSKEIPLRKLLEKSRMKMDIDDVRVMGYVKQKYPKEGAILRLTVNKRPFFRADYSIDLLRARQKIVLDLTDCLGEFRDFNGGMILKQEEALTLLRKELGKLSQEKEFILENYFYSLKPAVMQTVHDSSTLKIHFDLLNAVIGTDFKIQPYKVVSKQTQKMLLLFISAASSSFKAPVMDAIGPFESRNLTTSYLEIKNTSSLGFILRLETDIAEKFTSSIEEALREWARRFLCINP